MHIAGSGKPIDARQHNVHQDDVRLYVANALNDLSSGTCLKHNLNGATAFFAGEGAVPVGQFPHLLQ